jgi:hypothetical protein
MFTRDISFEDCILDLIDNSIDSLVREQDIDPAKEILATPKERAKSETALNTVQVNLDPKEIVVQDDCGGIPKDLVEDELFAFGHSPDFQSKQQLGIYGVGLKRAIFKIAEKFEMASSTTSDSFKAQLNVEDWAAKEEAMEDWRIPVTFGKPSTRTGTTITFSPVRAEVKMRLRDGAFLGKLTQSIAQTYALFLERHVRVKVNGDVIKPEGIPIGESTVIKPGQSDFTTGDVKVRIICGLAARNPMWTYERGGWYVLCNGRVVVSADKTELTGWNIGLPSFHSKYKGFVGVAIFRSKNPLALPWTTTKRGLNRESTVFQDAKREMTMLARPIISFLNNMYSSDSSLEEPEEREIAGKVRQADLRRLSEERPVPFKSPPKLSIPRTTMKIQYEADAGDVDRIRKVLRQPKWSANKIGKHTFVHFVKKECPE